MCSSILGQNKDKESSFSLHVVSASKWCQVSEVMIRLFICGRKALSHTHESFHSGMCFVLELRCPVLLFFR